MTTSPPASSPAGIPHGNLRAGLAWYAVAHLALAAAGGLLATRPALLLGPWQQPRLVAVVHLVTLGWIAASVVGSLLLLGQGVLRLGLVAGRRELWAAPLWGLALAAFASRIGTVDPLGLALTAAPLLALLTAVAVGVLVRAPRSPLPAAMRYALVLAWSNLLLALFAALVVIAARLGWTGWLDAFAGPGSTSGRSLPAAGSWMAWRQAHLALAVVGWATTLVVGVGTRMLPMVLPAAVPPGPVVATVASLLGLGTPILAGGWIYAPATVPFVAWLPLAGMLGWVILVAWMLAHPRAPARELPQPDAARWLAIGATAGLALAIPLAGALAHGVGPATGSPASLPLVAGVLLLLGFLGATILAVELRLLPTVAWVLARRRLGYEVAFPSAHRLPSAPLAWSSTLAMGLAVALLTAGAWQGSPGAIRAGALALLAAPTLHALLVVHMLLAGRRCGPP
jgi:hypothetical protein